MDSILAGFAVVIAIIFAVIIWAVWEGISIRKQQKAMQERELVRQREKKAEHEVIFLRYLTDLIVNSAPFSYTAMMKENRAAIRELLVHKYNVLKYRDEGYQLYDIACLFGKKIEADIRVME